MITLKDNHYANSAFGKSHDAAMAFMLNLNGIEAETVDYRYAENSDGYIVAFEPGQFDEKNVRMYYHIEHRDASKAEEDAYILKAKREYDEFFRTHYVKTSSAPRELQGRLAPAEIKAAGRAVGIIMSDHGSVDMYNIYKQDYDEPAKMKGLGTKGYNLRQAKIFQAYTEQVEALKSIQHIMDRAEAATGVKAFESFLNPKVLSTISIDKKTTLSFYSYVDKLDVDDKKAVNALIKAVSPEFIEKFHIVAEEIDTWLTKQYGPEEEEVEEIVVPENIVIPPQPTRARQKSETITPIVTGDPVSPTKAAADEEEEPFNVPSISSRIKGFFTTKKDKKEEKKEKPVIIGSDGFEIEVTGSDVRKKDLNEPDSEEETRRNYFTKIIDNDLDNVIGEVAHNAFEFLHNTAVTEVEERDYYKLMAFLTGRIKLPTLMGKEPFDYNTYKSKGIDKVTANKYENEINYIAKYSQYMAMKEGKPIVM
jgi:hypothetical protein